MKTKICKQHKFVQARGRDGVANLHDSPYAAGMITLFCENCAEIRNIRLV